MAYVLCVGTCITCRKQFTFNPSKVPSVRAFGNREPICLSCVNEVNPLRVAHGYAPIVVKPGAYEAENEEDILFV